MKTVFAFLLLCVSFAHAADNVSTNVFDKHDATGALQYRMETVYRGNEKVMMIMSRTNLSGVVIPVSRSYFVDTDLVMVEADIDRDGFFEIFATYLPGKEDVEVFSRQRDGSAKPAEAKIFANTKKQLSAASEFMNDIFRQELRDKK